MGVSPREELEDEIDHFESELQLTKNELERYYLTDTTLTNGLDSVIALLEQENSPEATEALYSYYLQKGDTVAAQAALAALQNVAGYETVVTMQTLLLNQDTSVFDIVNNSSTLQQVNQLANDTIRKGYLIARSTERLVSTKVYPELIEEIPTAQVLRQAFVEKEELKRKLEENNQIKVYPNPAKDRLIIEYKFTDELNHATLYDMMGHKVKSISLNGKSGRVIIDINNLSKGIYFYNILSSSTIITTDKLVIIKD